VSSLPAIAGELIKRRDILLLRTNLDLDRYADHVDASLSRLRFSHNLQLFEALFGFRDKLAQSTFGATVLCETQDGAQAPDPMT
jgi:hypothetical protein